MVAGFRLRRRDCFFRAKSWKLSLENFNRRFLACLCLQISGNVADLTSFEHELQPGYAFNFYFPSGTLIAVFANFGRAFTCCRPVL
jgi:hypothetical protein